MNSPFSRSRVAVGTLACVVTAACNESPSAPSRNITPSSASRDAAASAGRYIVLAKGNGFSNDFTNIVASLGGKVVRVHQGAGVAVVSGLTSSSASALANNNGIAEVDADVTVAADAPVAPTVASKAASLTAHGASTLNPASAVFFSWQWNMRSIHADVAWAHGKLGDPGVTVAIIDSGIDYDDPDLNGLVDLSRSTSFSASDDALRAAYFPSRNVITDFDGHGTNVAAQVSSNAVGFAGVTSKTTLIGVKVLGQDNTGFFSDILAGIIWSADHGADVANMSIEGVFSKNGNGRLNAVINQVLNYANKKGMLMVVAAGNSSTDLDHNGNSVQAYCSMPHVVCVSAVGPLTFTGSPDVPAFYTNYGRSSITVAGPGGNADAADGFPITIWPWGPDFASWVWSFCSKTAVFAFGPGGVPITPCASGDFIDGYIGTSQATPHVTGLAALLVATTGRGQPAQIKHLITASADDLGQPGTDPYYGSGRINVARALGY